MKKKNVLGNKYFLYATEFFAGMCVMAVELGASRLLAPYFSSSQIVWTVIIGAIMIAMALGNVWGGRLVDRNPNPDKLYNRLLIAAVWIALIPFLGKYVIAGVSIAVAAVVEHNFLVWASLASCLVLFVFPLMLLGTVTPSLVKFTVEDLDNNGAIVGKLGALNTIGSIIGTFLPTFVTIPAVGTAATFLIFAGILALLGFIYYCSIKRNRVKAAAAIFMVSVLSFFATNYSFAFWETDVVYEGESIYNYLQVKENETSVILSTNVIAGVQSIKMKDASMTGMYYDYALAAPFLAGLEKNEQGDILILGLGTGTYATMCKEYFPSSQIEGVEIDKKIVNLAKKYFELPDTVKVSVNDGRAYLAADKKYDVIMVDAYQDITIPFQMSTVEFFTLVKEHLTETGVMVVNLNMTSREEGSINEALCDTIRHVFPEVYTAQVKGGTNTELFAFSSTMQMEDFEKNYTAYCGSDSRDDLYTMMREVQRGFMPVSAGAQILTDDKAPVEVLGMRAMDEIIQDEIKYYKNKIREGGLEEVFN